VKKLIRILDSILNTILLIILILAIGYGAYALWDANKVVQDASAVHYQEYKPTESEGAFDNLTDLNPDAIGWLEIYGTNIDYPIVQGADNWEYLNKDAKGNYSLAGSIFMDAENQKDFSDFNTILYGHNVEEETMFGSIREFTDQKYFDDRPYGDLYYGNRHYGLRIFEILTLDAYNSSIYRIVDGNEADHENYLTELSKLAVQKRDIDKADEERLLLMSTCSNAGTNIRNILVAGITEETFPDTFSKS